MDRGGKRSKFRASVAMPCRNKLNRALDGQVRRIAWPATSDCVRELAAQP